MKRNFEGGIPRYTVVLTDHKLRCSMAIGQDDLQEITKRKGGHTALEDLVRDFRWAIKYHNATGDLLKRIQSEEKAQELRGEA